MAASLRNASSRLVGSSGKGSWLTRRADDDEEIYEHEAGEETGRPVVNGPGISRLLARGAYDVIMYHNTSLIGGPALLSLRGHANE